MKQLDTKLFLFSIFLMIPITLFFEGLFSGNYLNQVLLFSLPILWPGLAHGSLDLDIAKHKGIINNNFEMLLFLLIYILVPIIFFFSWINYPHVLFIIFLALSILHFGISDCIEKSKFSFIEVLIRGIFVISLPFKFHLEESIEIFSFFFVDSFFLIEVSKYFNYLYFFLILLIFVWLLKSWLMYQNKSQVYLVLSEFILLFFCFWFFEPLLSFFMYFCFLHSTRHLLDEKNNLDLKFGELFFKTLPMTVITILFFTLIYYFMKNDINLLQINYIVVGLSSLTVSHILLVNFLKN